MFVSSFDFHLSDFIPIGDSGTGKLFVTPVTSIRVAFCCFSWMKTLLKQVLHFGITKLLTHILNLVMTFKCIMMFSNPFLRLSRCCQVT